MKVKITIEKTELGCSLYVARITNDNNEFVAGCADADRQEFIKKASGLMGTILDVYVLSKSLSATLANENAEICIICGQPIPAELNEDQIARDMANQKCLCGHERWRHYGHGSSCDHTGCDCKKFNPQPAKRTISLNDLREKMRERGFSDTSITKQFDILAELGLIETARPEPTMGDIQKAVAEDMLG